MAASAPVLSVVDLTAFELEIKVPDSFARDLAIGMPAEISAGVKKYAGRVRSVSPEVVNGEVASRLEFVGDKPAGLRQNQRLTARILLDEKANVLMVERGPFLEAGGGHVAYLVRDGVAERRPIRTGAASLDAVEILSGAAAGDRIVVSGADASKVVKVEAQTGPPAGHPWVALEKKSWDPKPYAASFISNNSIARRFAASGWARLANLAPSARAVAG